MRKFLPYFALALGLVFISIALQGCDNARGQWQDFKHDLKRL